MPKKNLRILLLVAIIISLFMASFLYGSLTKTVLINNQNNNQRSEGADYFPGELLVKFDHETNHKLIEHLSYQGQLKITQVNFVNIQSLSDLSQLTQIVSVEPVFQDFHIDIQNEIAAGKSVDESITQLKRQAMQKSSITISDVEVLDLSPYYRITLSPNSNIETAIARYESTDSVVYAEPNYLYRTSFIPNDPFYDLQWAHQKLQSEHGWNLEQGNSDVVIAIVDTGVDYNHGDLIDNMWINDDEIPDDGIDNDDNGRVDDIYGWDYVNVDNNPMDDNGHGTHCAGIAAARGNNAIGISGVCPKCSIMTLKTFDDSGTGYSSVSATAIVYAANNEADIISNSWGSYSFSATLEAAINFAATQGVLVVGAAGNYGEEFKFYPAAYDNTLAVAATNENDERSVWTIPQPPFPGTSSNFGFWVDVAAPGSSIYSTILDNRYAYYNGTSMAAPHVAGLAGLILSQNPSFSGEEVRDIVFSSADTIHSDKYMGSGRINANNALQVTAVMNAQLTSPVYGDLINGSIDIQGTASGLAFQNYTVVIGSGIYPTTWMTIVDSTTPVINGSLGSLDTTVFEDGLHTIRLYVNDTNANTTIKEAVLIIDNSVHPGWPIDLDADVFESSPVFSDLDNDGHQEILIYSFREGVLYVFNSDGTIHWTRDVGGRYPTAMSPAMADLDQDGKKEILLGTNPANDNKFYVLNHDGNDVAGWPRNMGSSSVDSPGIADIDNNGTLDIVVVTNYDSSSKDILNVYVWNLDGTDVEGWPKTFDLSPPPGVGYINPMATAPSIGDLDNDGLLEIVVGMRFGDVYAWNHDGTIVDGWPVNLDDGSGWSQTMSTAIGDIDYDGTLEIAAFNIGSGSVNILENNGTQMAGWPKKDNFYALSPPVLGDLDRDHDLELVFQSNNDKVYAYHHTGEMVSGWPVNLLENIGNSAWQPPVIGDIDGDGKVEILISGDEKKIFAWHGDGSSVNGWPKQLVNESFSSPIIGDFDSDGKTEVVAADVLRVYMWDAMGNFERDNIEWGEIRHDARNTGNHFGTKVEDYVKLPNCEVVASDYQDGHPPEDTIDGDLRTRWSALGDGQWIQYDLCSTTNVGYVKIAWLRGNQRIATFDIEVSSDGIDWNQVYSGQSSGTTLNLESYDFNDLTARYVRIIGYGNTENNWNSINEVEIYGKKDYVKLPNCEVVASDYQDGHPPEDTIDGDLRTRWSALGDGQWIQYNLCSTTNVGYVKIAWLRGNQRIATFDIEVSSDGIDWNQVYSGQSSGTTLNLESYDFNDLTARYVRIIGYGNTENNWNSINEVEIYGKKDYVKLPNCEVVASDYQDGHPPEDTIDGDLRTRWSALGDGQWIQYDLCSTTNVGYVKIAWLRGNQRIATFDIEVSSDGIDWNQVYSGQSSGTTLNLESYDFNDLTARYVRIIGYGNTENNWNSINEVVIYGI